jgi:cytoskeletal protein CcmA (bactofilin family)
MAVTPIDRQAKLEPQGEFPPFTHQLAADVTISGRLTFPSNARIDGRLSGEVKAQALLVVGPTATLQANVSAEKLVVFGTLRGNVWQSGTVELRSGAALIGNVEARKFVVQEGAKFEGRCTMGQTASSAPSSGREPAPAARRQA